MLVFTLPDHVQRNLLLNPDRVFSVSGSNTAQDWQVQTELENIQQVTVMTYGTTFQHSIRRVDKSLQQMEMGKEIPPEVRSDIRVHLYLCCVDLPFWHMLSKSTELCWCREQLTAEDNKSLLVFQFPSPRRWLSVLNPFALGHCYLLHCELWNKKRMKMKNEVEIPKLGCNMCFCNSLVNACLKTNSCCITSALSGILHILHTYDKYQNGQWSETYRLWCMSLDSLMQKYGGCFHVNHLNLTEISPRFTPALMEPVRRNKGK